MKRIVLLRHGESTWNKDNRFTGWTDVDLTEKGIADANQAGTLLKEKGFHFDKAYTSFLKRAVKTLNCVLDKMDQDWIPVEKSWRLNEKHYGVLQGLNKSETASKYGEEQVLIWRRSFNVAPKALSEDDPRNPKTDTRYKEVPDKDLPRTESLKETVERILPYWKCIIFPNLATANELLVVAHGNSLRGIIKYLKHKKTNGSSSRSRKDHPRRQEIIFLRCPKPPSQNGEYIKIVFSIMHSSAIIRLYTRKKTLWIKNY